MTTYDPKVVDAELAEIHHELAKLENRINGSLAALHSMVGDTKEWLGKRTYWKLGDAEAERRAIAEEGVAPYDKTRIRETLASLEDLRGSHRNLRNQAGERNDVWRKYRWTRFFLVTGGHIHSSMGCSTCYPTTEFGWLPQLSGETEAEAVAAHGALLCTICYPTAPVEWTNKYELDAAAKKAEQCPGSGTHDYEQVKPVRYHRAYQRCPHCEKMVSITSTGKMRGHKPE